MNEKPKRPRLDPSSQLISQLNALDLALESQQTQAETENLLRCTLPLFDAVQRVCRGFDQHGSKLPPGTAESVALLAELADQVAAACGLAPTGIPGERAQRDLHEVVETREQGEPSHGLVLEVVQPGWSFAGRQLRRAKVIVSRNSVEKA